MQDPSAAGHHAGGFPAFAKACRQLYARHHSRPMPRHDDAWRPFYDNRIGPEQAVRSYVANLESNERRRKGR